MKQLEREHGKQNRVWTGVRKRETVSFREWFGHPARSAWKLGWWDYHGATARRAKEVAQNEYGRRLPHTFVSCRRNDYRQDDWVLSFRLTKRGASAASWIYVDRVVPVSRRDKHAYDEDYPYQAIQVWAPRHYAQPPFTITRAFRKAFRRASVAFGANKIKKLRSPHPPHALMTMINRRMTT
jgi:hypothetical protein